MYENGSRLTDSKVQDYVRFYARDQNLKIVEEEQKDKEEIQKQQINKELIEFMATQ